MRGLVLLLALLLPSLAQAADPPWPTRPVTLVVAYPPGAIVDTVGRRVAEQLSTALSSNVVVENRSAPAATSPRPMSRGRCRMAIRCYSPLTATSSSPRRPSCDSASIPGATWRRSG